jgi:hypothetical protein
MILFVDDEKLPQQFGLDAKMLDARTAAQALEMIEKGGATSYISIMIWEKDGQDTSS